MKRMRIANTTFTVNLVPTRYILTRYPRSYLQHCLRSTNETVTCTAPKLFLYFGETLKHEASGRAFQRVSNLRRRNIRGSTEKEMHMICLHIERAYRPGIGFADAVDFPFYKRRELAGQNLLAVFGTPDKVIGQFVGDALGVLCMHPYTSI